MSASDSIHEAVKNALIKDGWTITHDPYTASYGTVRILADLGAEKLFAVERGTERIVVEIKSFSSPSPIHDFEQAIGQFLLYRIVLQHQDEVRKLYLAVSETVDKSLFTREGIRATVDEYNIPRIVVRIPEEEIVSWIG